MLQNVFKLLLFLFKLTWHQTNNARNLCLLDVGLNELLLQRLTDLVLPAHVNTFCHQPFHRECLTTRNDSLPNQMMDLRKLVFVMFLLFWQWLWKLVKFKFIFLILSICSTCRSPIKIQTNGLECAVVPGAQTISHVSCSVFFMINW